MDLWIEYFYKDEKYTKYIGTFKTLKDDDVAMYTMASLLADFIIEERIYICSYTDAFIWEGVNVYPIFGAGTRSQWCHFCKNMDEALKLKNELLETHPCVIIRDNETREETSYQI